MSNIIKAVLILTISVSLYAFVKKQKDGPDPWKPEQMITPEDLNKKIKPGKPNKLLIINVGPMQNILGAKTTGSVSSPEGMTAFKALVDKEKKDKEVVIYCGCCTTDNCPNIRPAFKYLTEKGFKKHKVLNIKTGLYEDWEGKGFPMQK